MFHREHHRMENGGIVGIQVVNDVNMCVCKDDLTKMICATKSITKCSRRLQLSKCIELICFKGGIIVLSWPHNLVNPSGLIYSCCRLKIVKINMLDNFRQDPLLVSMTSLCFGVTWSITMIIFELCKPFCVISI